LHLGLKLSEFSVLRIFCSPNFLFSEFSVLRIFCSGIFFDRFHESSSLGLVYN
jgi:hypothetical protein